SHPLFRTPPLSTLFPYTTLFRSPLFRLAFCNSLVACATNSPNHLSWLNRDRNLRIATLTVIRFRASTAARSSAKLMPPCSRPKRSEEHTSELQSLRHLVCRLLLE